MVNFLESFLLLHYEEMYVEFKFNFKIVFYFLCFNLGNSENELEGDYASICGEKQLL
jgi:hypothetical protein